MEIFYDVFCPNWWNNMNGMGRNSFVPACRWAYFDETHAWLTKCCKEQVKFHENSTTGSVVNMVIMDGQMCLVLLCKNVQINYLFVSNA
jgi:hypothetical protein